MRARTLIRFSYIVVLFLCVPSPVFADTIVDSDISEDVLWTKAGSPYLIQGGLTIDQNATLSIEPGVVVQVDSGWIDVLGRLLAQGTSNEPITFTSATGNRWYGLDFENQETASSLGYIIIQRANTGISDYFSKDLSISNARVEDGRYGIEAYGSHLSLTDFSAENMSGEALDISHGSDVILKNFVLKNVGMSVQIYVDSKADISNLFIDGARGEALAVYVGSSMHVASSTIKNVSQSYGAVEAFSDSSADISNLTLDKVSQGETLNVFDNSIMTVNDSSISNSNWWDAIGVFDHGHLIAKNIKITNGIGDGINVYTGSSVDLQGSVISGFTSGVGIADYGSSSFYPADSILLTNNEIKNNDIGVGLYSGNSSYAISNNSIHGNASHGLEFYGTGTVDVSHNFWGDPSGPYNNPDNLAGTGDTIWYAPGGIAAFSPWLLSWGDPCAAPAICSSNVLFLPGIEASRLYRPDGQGGDKKLWEPSLLDTLHDLYLTGEGKSARNDIYTKAGDVVDETPVTGANIYKSFIAKMNGFAAAGTINAWEADPYDWRLSLDDILTHGRQTGTRISYLDATSTPYIIQELKRLAATSKTHKVTVVAHSNGGLVAKKLTELLGPDASTLIDKMIFVAVPQAGTPAAVAADMHGYGQSFGGGLYVTQATARTFASTSPMSYNLLPSAQYFTQIDNPVISFDVSLPDWIARYGATIHSQESLRTFLTGSYGRVDAQAGDIDQPIQSSGALLAHAEALHTDIDTWVPPAGVPLVQIAGWGVPTTVAGLTYTKKDTGVRPEANFTVDGDGTVVVPSALWTSTAAGAVNYWMDLKSYNRSHVLDTLGGLRPFNHANILETDTALNFVIDQIVSATKPLSDYVYLSTQTPSASGPRLRYALHSPLTLNLYDDQGRHTGVSTSTGAIEEQIPGTYYTEFGDVKYLFSDASTSAHIVMNGYAPGTFTFTVDEYSGDALTASTTFKDIPTTAGTVVALDVQSDISTLSPMQIDKNGDGTTDVTIIPRMNGIATFPRYRWDGFLQPINDTAHQAGQGISVFKSGSTIPVKFQLKTSDGTPVQASTSPLWLAPQKGPVYSDPGTSGTAYKWDSTAQQYMYNWNTKGLAVGYWYKVYAKLDDGQTYSAIVGLK